MWKAQIDDAESREKAPSLYQTMDSALIKKDDKVAFSALSESIEWLDFRRAKEENKYKDRWW